MIRFNPLLKVDSYKFPHFLMYEPGTTFSTAYLEARGGLYDKTLVVGLVANIKKHLMDPFTKEDIDDAEFETKLQNLPFNREGFEYILEKYNGYFPVKIDALPEGSVVKTGTPIIRVSSTDENVPWVVGFLEDIILWSWYSMTIGSKVLDIKILMKKYVDETSDNPESLEFKLHDFGLRSATSLESASIAGGIHGFLFSGSDTIIGNKYLRWYYSAGNQQLTSSIPATEHSTITSWGRTRESKAYRNLLKIFGDNSSKYKCGMIACVSDSYDLYNCIDNIWGDELKQTIIDSDTMLLVRPDSGDPLMVVMLSLEKLGNKFGYTINSKGYKVLNHVRLVQGDGVNRMIIENILKAMKSAKWSIDNISFGMGTELHQNCNRDTMKVAYKQSMSIINGEVRMVFKDPITDPGKRSKIGFVDVILKDGEYISIVNQTTAHPDSVLIPFYENGDLKYDPNYNDIKNSINSYLGY